MSAKLKPMSENTQEYLPGQAPEKNDKIHRNALAYARLHNAALEAAQEAKSAHAKLLMAMDEAGLTNYAYGNIAVDKVTASRCKVSTGKKKGEDEEEVE